VRYASSHKASERFFGERFFVTRAAMPGDFSRHYSFILVVNNKNGLSRLERVCPLTVHD
jgi:hypothetical protein